MNVLLPRPIHTRAGYREATAVAEMMAGRDLSDDQDDYLGALTLFIEEWESANEPKLPAASPAEMVASLMRENDLSGADLAHILGVSRSLASRILRGERNLTTSHIATLSARFGLNSAAFLPTAV